MEWPKIITDRPPNKSEFKVFDNLPHGGAYKTLEGRQKYNDEMYQEALNEFNEHGGWIKYSNWFDDLKPPKE